MIQALNAWLKDNTAAAAAGAVFLLIVRPLIARWYKGYVTWTVLKGEQVDLKRHLGANAARIGEMINILKVEGQVPQRNHLLKLAVSDNMMIFNDGALEHLTGGKVARIHRARLRLRNLNIDVAEAVRQWDQRELAQLPLMLDHLRRLHERLEHWATDMFGDTDSAPPSLPVVSTSATSAENSRGQLPPNRPS